MATSMEVAISNRQNQLNQPTSKELVASNMRTALAPGGADAATQMG